MRGGTGGPRPGVGTATGYRERSLLTELGMLEHLRVPRDREGRYQTEVLPRYQRRQEGVNRMVRTDVPDRGQHAQGDGSA